MNILALIILWNGLPQWFSSKESACNTGDTRDAGSISGLGRSPEGGHDNLLQCSCLENPIDRGAWWATVHRVTKSQTQLKWLHTYFGIWDTPASSLVAQSLKKPPAMQETKDAGSISGLGRSPGGGHDNPLQYSCLENPMDRGAWQAMVHRVAKSRT